MSNENIVALKKTLRQEMLTQRLHISSLKKKEYDLWICKQLLNIIIERKVKVVHAYLPMGKEIEISPLIIQLLQMEIKVVTPKTLPNRVLENRILHDINEIEKGVFGTTHPRQTDIYEGPFDLAIVPGLAFDEENYRLGYGGGYYDNFLVRHPATFKVGIFYPFQKVERVPLEEHDLKLDKVIYPIK